MIKLEANEKILLTVRKHSFFFFLKIFGTSLFAIIPLVIYFIGINFITLNLPQNSELIFLFIYLIWILMLWIYVFIEWTDYYLDLWLITNERLIDINQKGLFVRQISTLSLDKIQDAKVEIRGILSAVLNIGNIHVQTAGTTTEFLIENAHNPEKIKTILLEAYKNKINEVKTVRIES